MKELCNMTIGVGVRLCLAIAMLGCQSIGVVLEDRSDHSYGPPIEKGPPPWAPAHGYRAKYQYRYYPSSCVYSDVGRGLYFYMRGDQWEVSATLPVGIHLQEKGYVTLYMDTEKPYEFQTEVIKRYPPGQQKKLFKAKGKGRM